MKGDQQTSCIVNPCAFSRQLVHLGSRKHLSPSFSHIHVRITMSYTWLTQIYAEISLQCGHNDKNANAIASKLIENGRHRNVDKQVDRDVNAEIATLKGSVTSIGKSIKETFTEAEMLAAVSHLKSGQAQGPEHIAPEFIINCGTLMLNWLSELFSQCMHSLRLPNVWRRADIIAVLKPNKSADDAKNYRPISLLCVPLKLLERRPVSLKIRPGDRPTTPT